MVLPAAAILMRPALPDTKPSTSYLLSPDCKKSAASTDAAGFLPVSFSPACPGTKGRAHKKRRASARLFRAIHFFRSCQSWRGFSSSYNRT